MKLYRKVCISAGHKLNLPYESACENPHGHNFVVELFLEGDVNRDTGMVIDFVELKKIVSVLDHKWLNVIKGLEQPTAENIVLFLINRFRELAVFSRIRVRVWETENSYAEDEWVSE
jgi:6-pyruvoyltetrahydropterin/6-carboxytetrahydropterin synthase